MNLVNNKEFSKKKHNSKLILQKKSEIPYY